MSERRSFTPVHTPDTDEMLAYVETTFAGRAWPAWAVSAYLTRRQDLALAPKPQRFPGRRAIAKHVGWTEDEVRSFLRSEGRWSDDHKAEKWASYRETAPVVGSKRADSPVPPPSAPRAAPVAPPPRTEEPAESETLAPVPPPCRPRAAPVPPHTRVGFTGSPDHNITSEDNSNSAGKPARVRPLDEDTLRAWSAYRDAQLTPPVDAPPTWVGTRRGDRPPARWGVAARVAEHGADAVIAVVEWAHQSRHQRAAWLRDGGYLGETLFRVDKFATYAGFAAAWVAAGRVDRPDPLPRSRGRPELMSQADLNAATLALLAGDFDADCQRDPDRVFDA